MDDMWQVELLGRKNFKNSPTTEGRKKSIGIYISFACLGLTGGILLKPSVVILFIFENNCEFGKRL